MTWLDTTVEISFPVLVSALTSVLVVLLAAGVLWIILHYTPMLVARYVPILNGIGLSLLRPLIVVGELVLIARFMGLAAATALAALLALYSFSKTLREIYLIINNQISFTPVSGAILSAVAASEQKQAPLWSAPPARRATTTTTTSLAVPLADGGATRTARLETRQLPILTPKLGIMRAERPLPQYRLKKRAKLGKLTVRAFLK